MVIQEKCHRNEKFLEQLDVIDNKNKFYNYKYLKEVFLEISDNNRIQKGVFSLITLDEKIKTKVSTNRLAITIKNSVRGDDIVAFARGGKFYLIQPNIDLLAAKSFIDKIQNKMGYNTPIRAGISKIGIKSFETLDKNVQDGLIAAIQNDETSCCIKNNLNIENSWLEDEENDKIPKSFKFFKLLFTNKMENVITPIFFRFQKEFENKLTNTLVSQYTNNVESVFCLKNETSISELIIRYNGFAKFNVEITHNGLNSPENTKIELPLNEMTDKYLSSLLKKLLNEYKKSIEMRELENVKSE